MILGLLLLSAVVTAQSPASLDSRLGTFLIPNPLPPCAIEAVVARLARQAHVLVGFERSTDCPMTLPIIDTNTGNEDLSSLTIRQALDTVTSLDPAYRWEERDGFVVVRPSTAWTDAADPLNLQIAAFTVTEAPLPTVVQTMLHFSPSNRPESERQISRHISVTFAGGTLLDALNAISRAHQSMSWSAGVTTSPVVAQFSINVMTFDLSGFGTSFPLTRLQMLQ